MVENVAGGWIVDRRPISRCLHTALSLLVAVTVFAVAIPAAFGSRDGGAGVDPVEVFSSGPLVGTAQSGISRLSIEGLIPGQSRSAVVRIVGRGSVAAPVGLSVSATDQVGGGGEPLSDVLQLRIEKPGFATPIYDGPIGSMPRLALKRGAVGTERAYRFTVTLPREVGNAVEGSSMSAGFAWTGA